MKNSFSNIVFTGTFILLVWQGFPAFYPPQFSPDESDSDSLNTVDSLVADSLRADSLSGISGKPDSLAEEFPRKLNRKIVNNAFTVGEKLTFSIKYGFIKAGEATMEVKDMVTVYDSIPAYHIISTARSARAFDLFYKVRDRVESILDRDGLFSWEFRKILREGGYKFDLNVDYNQLYGKAHVEMIRYHNREPLEIRSQEEFDLPIPKYVLDILGAFYYVRTQRLEVGEPIEMANHDNKKIYNLRVIIQKRERVKVKAGKFNCILLQPRLQGEAIFKQKGKLWVWLTDDEFKIPVKMKSKVAVGSISTELIKIEGINKRITARVD